MTSKEAFSELTNMIAELSQLRGTVEALFPDWKGNIILYSADKIKELHKENEKLKYEKKIVEDTINHLNETINNLHNEMAKMNNMQNTY
jgi:predicted nuclease with TOPRIM domain